MGALIAAFDFAPINTAWHHLKLIWQELLPAEAILNEKISLTQQLLATKLSPIGERFIRQELKTPTGKAVLEPLKVRLVKAAGYFFPNLTELYQHLLQLHRLTEGTPFHSDYFPTLNLLLECLAAKIEVFNILPNIKHAADLTKALRNTATKYEPLDSWKQKQIPTETKIEHPALYAELMNWRAKTAEMKKALDYHIISDQAMADISAKLPRTLTQLSKIKNVGEGKTAAYGEQILRMIRHHLGENELFF